MILRRDEKASFSDWVRWRSRTLAMTRWEWRSSKGWSSLGPSGVGASDTTVVGLFFTLLEPAGSRLVGLPVLLSSAWLRLSFLGYGERLRFPDGWFFFDPLSSSSSLAPSPPSGELVQETSSLIVSSTKDFPHSATETGRSTALFHCQPLVIARQAFATKLVHSVKQSYGCWRSIWLDVALAAPFPAQLVKFLTFTFPLSTWQTEQQQTIWQAGPPLPLLYPNANLVPAGTSHWLSGLPEGEVRPETGREAGRERLRGGR